MQRGQLRTLNEEASAISLGTNNQLPSVLVLLTVLIAAAPAGGHKAAANTLTIKNDGRTAGYVTLGWRKTDTVKYTVEQQKNGTWVTIYEGPDTATTLTGLPDGAYIFRIAEEDGEVSEPLTVKIEHHALWKALAFFFTGLILFMILLTLIFAKPFSERSARSPS